MKVLDLFSGIGGFSLGLERAGMETVAFCEIEEYPCSILKKHWPDVPIFNDVKELHAKDLPGAVDLICGGYPCQPFSVAGKRRGEDDDRHLWPEIVRIIRELDATTGKPYWCIFENVAGHVSLGLDTVLSDLENEGYTCWPFIIPACSVNAPHRRDRVWIVAYSGLRRREGRIQRCRKDKSEMGERTSSSTLRASKIDSLIKVANAIADNPRHGSGDCNANDEKFRATDFCEISEWISLPGVRSRDDGLPNRVARLKALGNSVVPQIPEIIGRAIMEVN